jgi:hypothetical protein
MRLLCPLQLGGRSRGVPSPPDHLYAERHELAFRDPAEAPPMISPVLVAIDSASLGLAA